MKRTTRFVIALSIVFVLMLLVEINQESPIDWSPGFAKNQKKPYGNYLLYEMLGEIFPDQKIQTINQSVTEQLRTDDSRYSSNATYIFINESLYFNEYETNDLMQFVSEGNLVFMAGIDFSDTLTNSLSLIKKPFAQDAGYFGMGGIADSVFRFNFCHNIKHIDTGYVVRKQYDMQGVFFDSVMGDKKILAADENHHCILTEVRYGKGKFILCTLPYTFTNYYMVNPGVRDFILRTLGRIPLQQVWWDEYYKTGKSHQSPLHIIFDSKGLKWAYYLALIGLLLFVIFMGKRKQRVIPIPDPMKNTSLEFAETVGQVYYEKGDHYDLAQKKIKYLAEYIRSNYYLNMNLEMKRNPKEFVQNLSLKSGLPVSELTPLFNLIQQVETHFNISEKELIQLNTYIETFKKPDTQSNGNTQ